jgi:hypothetical protein
LHLLSEMVFASVDTGITVEYIFFMFWYDVWMIFVVS